MNNAPPPNMPDAQRRILERFARLEADEDRLTPLNRAIAAMLAENNRLRAQLAEALEENEWTSNY